MALEILRMGVDSLTDGPVARTSSACVVVDREGVQITLERKATVILYAREADDMVDTARHRREFGPPEQVLANAFQKIHSRIMLFALHGVDLQRWLAPALRALSG